jgi:hypothetical protein
MSIYPDGKSCSDWFERVFSITRLMTTCSVVISVLERFLNDPPTWEKPAILAWSSAEVGFWYNTVTGESSNDPPASHGHLDGVKNRTYWAGFVALYCLH